MLRRLLGGVAFLALSQGALAQEAEPAEQNQDIIVTAQRREQRLQDVPVTISAQSSEDLAAAGVTNVQDLSSVVAGLNFGGVGTALQPSIRGVNTLVSTGGSENPVALYVDDIYYSTPQLLGSNLPDVERIEVLKGPQGTLFGRNSVAGAIRIFTRNPSFTPAGTVTLEGSYFTGDGGSRASPRIAAAGFASLPIVDQKAAISVSGGYEWIDGFLTDVASGSSYGIIRRENARAKLLVEPSDNVRILLGGFYLQHNDTGANASSAIHGQTVTTAWPGSIIADRPFEAGYNIRPDGPQDVADVKTYGFTGNLEFDIPGAGKLTSLTGWNDNDILNRVTLTHARTSTACLVAFACIDYDYTYKTKALSQELNFVSEQFGILQVTAGLYYYRNRSHTTARIQPTIVPGGIPSKEEYFRIDAYAAYTEVELKPLDRLTVILGGRYTHEIRDDTAIIGANTIDKKVKFNSFIPRVAALFDVTDSLNLYASFAQGEKSGLSGIANTASVPPLQPVDAEKNTAYEVGMKFADSGYTFNVSAFYYNYKNKQEQGFTGSAVFLQNSGPAKYFGVDADASARLGDDFTLRGSLSWLPVAEYKDFPNAAAYGTIRNANGTFRQIQFDATGYRIPRAPEFTGNIGVDYNAEVGAGALDASANLAYSSGVYHDLYHMVRQASYATLNLRTGYTIGGVRFGLFARNITNETYIANTATSGLGYFANYARPREVGLSIGFNY